MNEYQFEVRSRIIVSCAPSDTDVVHAAAAARGVAARVIDAVGPREPEARFVIRVPGAAMDLPVSDVAEVCRPAIPRLMDRTAGASPECAGEPG